MRVIGTAGHVDHGKSTLVKRLTGIDPDRLNEEKQREMTIDLGFAWLTLHNGETVGIVDVPGHRDFIENMLAGIGGIDAVLLVIAADEGVMPQTREHLAILDLLGIETGLIALTKTDMVDDPEWLELVRQEVQDFVQPTRLAHAPIIPVSAHTGTGIDTLIAALSDLLGTIPTQTNYHHPRLPIDRAFSVSGFGTVVTGTLSGGTLSIGDAVEIQPDGLEGRIRGLQSYHQAVEHALPGSRVAVNISGIGKDAIKRGDVLTHPGQLRPTILVDGYYRHLPDASRPLKHNAEVKFFSGASESIARVRLLGDESLSAGQTGWLQLRLESPIALTQQDRFILRYPSPAETIGGGVIVNPHPGRRWKRFQQTVIDDLQIRLEGSPAERIEQATTGKQSIKRTALQKATGYTDAELDNAISQAVEQNRVYALADGTFIAASSYQQLAQECIAVLSQFHADYPLRLGMPREEIRSRLELKQQMMHLLLDSLGDDLIAEGGLVRLAGYQIQFSPTQQANIDSLMAQMQTTPYAPPSFLDARDIVGEDVLRALIDRGDIVQVQQDIIFGHEAYRTMIEGILTLIEEQGSITAKIVRDYFNTSRKYAIGLLEHTDSLSITRRVGDDRVRGSKADQFT